jgi:hypothetical protein
MLEDASLAFADPGFESPRTFKTSQEILGDQAALVNAGGTLRKEVVFAQFGSAFASQELSPPRGSPPGTRLHVPSADDASDDGYSEENFESDGEDRSHAGLRHGVDMFEEERRLRSKPPALQTYQLTGVLAPPDLEQAEHDNDKDEDKEDGAQGTHE